MADISATSPNTTSPKPKAKPSATLAAPGFENAFAGATFEAPAAFREFAEKGLSQAKDGYEKMKSAAEEANSLLETTYNSAAKGAADYGLKLIETARQNTNATFDYVAELVAAKSPSEVVELSATHARKQFESFTSQLQDLTGLAQKVMTETAEPLKDGFTRVIKKVA
jgi:phasin